MKNVFINGLNNKSGGGKSYLTNFIKLLKSYQTEDKYFVLVPPYLDFKEYESEHISIINVHPICVSSIFLPISYVLLIPFLIAKKKCSIIFNLSDLPILTFKKQIMLFDWPYGLYPNDYAWTLMNNRDLLKRKVKLFFVKILFRFVDIIVVQNSVMKKRLIENYNFHNVHIIHNATSLDNLAPKNNKRLYSFNRKINLLYLTYYYTHKNLEIFIPLAKKIIKKNLDYGIVTTISKNQGIEAEDFLKKVESENLSSVINNIGPVSMEDVPNLYMETDGLLMPTLLETFSGTYVEAMYHKKPIFTSDLDFARDICKDSAFYFNPLDHNNILECLNTAFSKKEQINEKINAGSILLSSYPSWQNVFDSFINLINE